MKTTEILTHQKPHIDELVAIFLLQIFGERINCIPTQVTFVAESNFLQQDHQLTLGVNGGKFDEHTRNGKKKKTSTVQLVSDALGITDKNYLNIVSYAHNNDVNGGKNIAELGNLIKNKFAMSYNDNEVYQNVMEVLGNKLFSLEHPAEYKNLAKKMRGQVFSKTDLSSKIINYKKQNLTRKKRIVLSNDFSIQDVMAVYMIKHFSKMKNLNYKTRVIFVDPHGFTQREGDLCIGFGDSEFADLPALKMKKQFNISENSEFKIIFEYLMNIHSRTGYHPYELAALLADRHLTSKYTVFDSFTWALGELKVFTKKQRMYFSAKNEFHEGFRDKKTEIIHCCDIKIAIINSDNRFISNVAFSADGYSNDLVIVRNTNGHVAIQTKKGLTLDLSRIVCKLRKSEIKAKGFEINGIDYKMLFQEGFVEICPEWFYFKETESIFNGSDIYININPTKLDTFKIKKIILTELKTILN